MLSLMLCCISWTSPIPSQTLQLPDGGYADKLSWTQGGSVLSVSTKQGALHSYATNTSSGLPGIGKLRRWCPAMRCCVTLVEDRLHCHFGTSHRASAWHQVSDEGPLPLCRLGHEGRLPR